MDFLTDPRLSGVSAILGIVMFVAWVGSSLWRLIQSNQGLYHILHDIFWAPIADILAALIVAFVLTLISNKPMTLDEVLSLSAGLSLLLFAPLVVFNFADLFSSKEEKGKYRTETLFGCYLLFLSILLLNSQEITIEALLSTIVVAAIIALSHIILYELIIGSIRSGS